MHEGADKLVAGSTGVEKISSGLYTGLVQYTDGISKVGEGVQVLEEGAGQYTAGVKALSDGTNVLYEGVNGYTNGVSALADGAKQLDDGAGALSSGAQTLDQSMNQMVDGSKQLADGTNQLNENSSLLVEAPDMLSDGLNQIKDGLTAVPNEEQIQLLTDGSHGVLQAVDMLSQGTTGLDQSVGVLQEQLQTLNTTFYSNEDIKSAVEVLLNATPAQLKLALALKPDDTMNALKFVSGAYLATDAALDEASKGVDQMKLLSSTLADGANKLNTNYQTLNEGIQMFSVLPQGVQAIQTGLDQMIDLIQNDLKTGITTYVSGVNSVHEGAQALYQGSIAIKSGTTTLSKGSTDLK